MNPTTPTNPHRYPRRRSLPLAADVDRSVPAGPLPPAVDDDKVPIALPTSPPPPPPVAEASSSDVSVRYCPTQPPPPPNDIEFWKKDELQLVM